MDDKQIIALFFERSEKAISALDSKYGKVCSTISRNILGNRQDAEECVNDAYLGAWNTIPPQNPNPLLTYLCRIVRNLSIKRYHANTAQKRNSYYDAVLDELEGCISSPHTIESEYSAKQLSALLDTFLADLSEETRILFLRRYWCSDSVGHIAQLFSISENLVSVRLARTRKKLRAFLEKEGITL